jgi:hypothetical protein
MNGMVPPDGGERGVVVRESTIGRELNLTASDFNAVRPVRRETCDELRFLANGDCPSSLPGSISRLRFC